MSGSTPSVSQGAGDGLVANPPADAFLAALQFLMPPGRAFPRDDTFMAQLLSVPADALATIRAAALQLANVEADPTLTLQLLADWEADFGLPDPCSTANPSIEQRRLSLLAKIASLGGQSRDYFINVAAALGFTITITEFSPFSLGRATWGENLLGPGWAFVWQVNAPLITVSRLLLGQGVWGDPFWTIGNTELQCRLKSIAPAHTFVTFNYS
jgi:uncharacterized protein YmfQ (DUF2313 family)